MSRHSPSHSSSPSLSPLALPTLFFAAALATSLAPCSAYVGADAVVEDHLGGCNEPGSEACPSSELGNVAEDDQGQVSLLQTVSSAHRTAKTLESEVFEGLLNLSFNEDFESSSMSVPLLKDVKSAFNNLDKTTGTVLRANIGRVRIQGYNQGFPPYSEHYQSVQRAQDSTVFYLSGSGSTTNTAQVFVLDLKSKIGNEVLGSNIDSRSPRPMPPSSDALLSIIEVDKEYWHAGGITSYENILVVGAEPGCSTTDRMLGRCKSASRVYFYDISTPEAPRKLPLVIERRAATAGTTSLVRKSDGRFLVCVGGSGAKQLDFYVSNTQDLTDPSTRFHLATSWSSDHLTVSVGVDDEYGEYQTLNFVRQADGGAYLIGLYRTLNGLGDDYADLFRLESSSSSSISLKKVANIHLKCPSDTCNFQAGAGAYVASEDTLLLYASNWEPDWKDGSIYLNEFRPSGSQSASSGGSQTKICEKDTGGSCSFFGCDNSRGPTACINKKCLCQPGLCVQDGRCVRQ